MNLFLPGLRESLGGEAQSAHPDLLRRVGPIYTVVTTDCIYETAVALKTWLYGPGLAFKVAFVAASASFRGPGRASLVVLLLGSWLLSLDIIEDTARGEWGSSGLWQVQKGSGSGPIRHGRFITKDGARVSRLWVEGFSRILNTELLKEAIVHFLNWSEGGCWARKKACGAGIVF